ncbi:hypothetical protein evm_013783 [Chilo suppressalis]|nr:hypothetical protein evm_013783 [Chilo suppressalis]
MSDETAIDIEMFVTLVEERPMLWDKNSELYKNRYAAQKAWSEITLALNPSLENESNAEKQAFEMLLRKKWRYLRDQYAVETSKIPRALEGSYTPKWPPFKSLHFLKGVIPRRDRKRKVRRSSSNTSDDQNDEQSDMAAMSYQEDESHDPFEDEVDVKPSRKKLIFASSNNAITYQEERPKEEDDNEHMYFFKSLLPHVREIPRRRLLAFRSCIQAIVEDFAYSTDANSSRFHQQPFQVREYLQRLGDN